MEEVFCGKGKKKKSRERDIGRRKEEGKEGGRKEREHNFSV